MDTALLQRLAKHLNLTDLHEEQEPYILTPEEEEIALENEVVARKKYAVWKMAMLGYMESQIEQKLLEIDFRGSIDRDELFQRANMCKNQDVWQKNKREEEKQEYIKKLEELTKTWTAKFVYAFMAWTSENVYGKELIVNPDNKKLISVLCFLISRDKRYETQFHSGDNKIPFSFNKGLLIRGKCGVGKTYLAQCIAKNGIKPILTLSMIDITDNIRAYGEYELQMGENKILYLDDVGTEEPVVKHYGTPIAWFKEFIETTYLKGKNFSNIIISTNMNFRGFEEKYGFRVASRMREVFNVIDIEGQDMRVNNE